MCRAHKLDLQLMGKTKCLISATVDDRAMCGNAPGIMPPFIGTTTEGDVFEFEVTFTSTSADGNATSSGFSLSVVCK